MMTSMKTAALPNDHLAALRDALKAENDEFACLASLVDIGKWAKREGVNDITIPLPDTRHDIVKKRIGVLKRCGKIEPNIVFTLTRQ